VSGGVDPGALRLLLARLRGALPAEISATVMLDGHAAPGTDRRQRVERNLLIQHAGSLSADDALLNMIRDAAAHDRAAIVLVTDDRSLIERARHLGARTQRLSWLEGLLAPPGGGGRPAGGGTGIGGGRPRTRPPTGAPAQSNEGGAEDERTPWQPGRGATRKRGNPRRGAR